MSELEREVGKIFTKYLEEVIQYSDVIVGMDDRISTAEVDIERNYDYAIQHADDINSNLSCEIEELKSEIESLKDMIEDLREG
tara:strand:- start:198 stop:446 length:249 start_codon:yes stop_codon:yes gene_type:complete